MGEFLPNGTRVVVNPKHRTDLVKTIVSGKTGIIIRSSVFVGTKRQYLVAYDAPEQEFGQEIESGWFYEDELVKAIPEAPNSTGKEILERLYDLLRKDGFKESDSATREQARALWVSACIFLDWECDTSVYDATLFQLWNEIRNDIEFDEFDAFMCVGLC